MEKEFVRYDQAVALKEFGFDEPCITFYHNDTSFIGAISKDSTITKGYKNGIYWRTSAPLKQQAFRFFREKYVLYPEVDKDVTGFYTAWKSFWIGGFKTYEEAEEACLDKLIEIARSVSDSEKTNESKQ